MATTAPDSPVAQAINRVLDAERAMGAAVAAAQAAAQASIEAAHERRRAILESARTRIVTLHERAQAQLNTRLAELDDAAERATDDDRLRALTDVAVARLAQRLTTDTDA